MANASARLFYDQLAAGYHLIYADWDASITRQAAALDAVIGRHLGPGPRTILDCACGIGTQAIGLAARGHHVTATDLSPAAVSRAAGEARARGLRLPSAAADMRALPLRPAVFDVIVCADNALPHLLGPADVRAALGEMRRLLKSAGLLVITTRPYDEIRETRPAATVPQVARTPTGRAVTFQLWDWRRDGEHYDLELFQVVEHGRSWSVSVYLATYWALTRDQVGGFVTGAGFDEVRWHEPAETGFFQPLLTARAPAR